MPFGTILGAVAGNLLQNTMGGSSMDSKGRPSFNSPGYGDGGTTPAPRATVSMQPLEDTKKGVLGKTNDFLGTDIGRFGTGVAGTEIGNALGRRSKRKDFEYLESKGLNPFEIHAGGGGGTGSTAGSGNVLGNAPQVQAQNQQAFEMQKFNKTLALEKYKADADVALKKSQTSKIDFELEHFWPIKYAGMSAENGMMSIAAFLNGVDLEQVLKGQYKDATKFQQQAVANLYDDFVKVRSVVGRESMGIMETMKQILNWRGNAGDRDQNILGDKESVNFDRLQKVVDDQKSGR